MIFKEYRCESKIKGRGHRSKMILICECDTCKKLFEVNACIKQYKEKINHFCSMKCLGVSRQKGNTLYNRSVKTSIEKYGVPFRSMTDETKNIVKSTCLKKYGVDSPSKSSVVKEKSKKTCLERYGVENTYQSKEFRQKIKETWIKKYGVDHPLRSKEIQEKIKKTCLKKYGVKHQFASKEVRSKIDWKLNSKKSRETMKKNMTFSKSKSEDLFYEFLCRNFGEENIERQVSVNNWIIDFYVKQIKSYVQFDGIYWHGLDRPINKIKNSLNIRDHSIFLAYLRDRKQDFWFKNEGKRMIRILDKEFLKSSKEQDFVPILERLMLEKKEMFNDF